MPSSAADVIHSGTGTPSISGVAAASAEQTECYGEHTSDAGRHYDVEAEAEFDVENGDVDGCMGLVEVY